MRKRKLINECRGPGIYNPELAFESTTKYKVAQQGKIPQGSINRFILPATQIENIYLTSSSSQKYLTNINNPELNRYNPEKNIPSTSLFTKQPTYRISNTLRSNIAKEDGCKNLHIFSTRTWLLQMGEVFREKIK